MEELIFTKEEMSRIHKSRKNSRIYADVHGMDRKTAKRFLHNLIAVHRESFTLGVIHGYNNGTVLKEMIDTEQLSSRVTGKVSPSDNPGITYMMVG